MLLCSHFVPVLIAHTTALTDMVPICSYTENVLWVVHLPGGNLKVNMTWSGRDADKRCSSILLFECETKGSTQLSVFPFQRESKWFQLQEWKWYCCSDKAVKLFLVITRGSCDVETRVGKRRGYLSLHRAMNKWGNFTCTVKQRIRKVLSMLLTLARYTFVLSDRLAIQRALYGMTFNGASQGENSQVYQCTERWWILSQLYSVINKSINRLLHTVQLWKLYYQLSTRKQTESSLHTIQLISLGGMVCKSILYTAAQNYKSPSMMWNGMEIKEIIPFYFHSTYFNLYFLSNPQLNKVFS